MPDDENLRDFIEGLTQLSYKYGYWLFCDCHTAEMVCSKETGEEQPKSYRIKAVETFDTGGTLYQIEREDG